MMGGRRDYVMITDSHYEGGRDDGTAGREGGMMRRREGGMEGQTFRRDGERV